MTNEALRRQIPSPGADWPATVRKAFFTTMGELSVINPETRKITILGPSASQAARKLPAPESFRLVTKMTLPPRPPGVVAPNPSAPGNAGISRVLLDIAARADSSTRDCWFPLSSKQSSESDSTPAIFIRVVGQVSGCSMSKQVQGVLKKFVDI